MRSRLEARAPGPLLFSVFVFPPPPAPFRSPDPPLTERSKTLGPIRSPLRPFYPAVPMSHVPRVGGVNEARGREGVLVGVLACAHAFAQRPRALEPPSLRASSIHTECQPSAPARASATTVDALGHVPRVGGVNDARGREGVLVGVLACDHAFLERPRVLEPPSLRASSKHFVFEQSAVTAAILPSRSYKPRPSSWRRKRNQGPRGLARRRARLCSCVCRASESPLTALHPIHVSCAAS